MAIQLISEITPKNSGSFALLDDEYLRGGLRVKETFEELADIPADRLKDGCLAVVKSPIKQIYTYNATDNEWTVFSSGGGDGGAAIYDDVTSEIYTWSSQKIASELEERLSLDDVDNVISPTSKKPVQNKVIAEALEEKISKDDVDSAISPYSKNPVQNKVIAEALENVKAGKTMTAEEYDALDDETKNDGSFYYISDTGEIYQNNVLFGGGRTIECTFEEYKQLEADGLVEPDVDYVIVSDEKGILLSNIDLEHGTSGITCYEVIEELKSDVTTLNTGVDKKESVYITNDPSGSGVLYNAAEYLGVNSVDTYGIYNLVVTTDTGESGECNFIYKHRVATYGNIISENGVTFDNLNEYGTVVVNSTSANRTFKIKYLGEPTEDMSGLSKYEYTRENKNALASAVLPKADRQNAVRNTDYLKSDRPYLKIARNGSLSHVPYYACETYILCNHLGNMGALSFIRTDNGASCVYKDIVGTLSLSVELHDEYVCWLKYSNSSSEIITVYALNGYKPTVSSSTSMT